MKEFKDKTEQELKKLITDKKEQLRHFRFGSAGAKTKNVKAGHNLKKDIARIMTELGIRTRTVKA